MLFSIFSFNVSSLNYWAIVFKLFQFSLCTGSPLKIQINLGNPWKNSKDQGTIKKFLIKNYIQALHCKTKKITVVSQSLYKNNPFTSTSIIKQKVRVNLEHFVSAPFSKAPWKTCRLLIFTDTYEFLSGIFLCFGNIAKTPSAKF